MTIGSRQVKSCGNVTSNSVRVALVFSFVSEFVYLLPLLWFGCIYAKN